MASRRTKLYLSATIHTEIPRDAERSGLNRDNDRIARVKAIVIIGIHGQRLVSLPFPPGVHERAAGAAYDSRHVVAAFYGGGVVSHLLLGVQFSIQEQSCGENPRQRDESDINPFEHHKFLAIPRAAVEDDSQRQREEKYQAEEHQYPVELERRIDLADVGKRQRPGKKYGGAPQPPGTGKDLRGPPRETPGGTLFLRSRRNPNTAERDFPSHP